MGTLAEKVMFERWLARMLVLMGGVSWSVVFALRAGTGGASVGHAGIALLAPLTVALSVLGIGWYLENAATVLLAASIAGVVAWGVHAGWALGLWVVVGALLVGPMAIAASLFWMARRDCRRLQAAALACPAFEG